MLVCGEFTRSKKACLMQAVPLVLLPHGVTAEPAISGKLRRGEIFVTFIPSE